MMFCLSQEQWIQSLRDLIFIDLGDIINLRAIRRINDIFRNYMGDDEIQQFNDDLLKKFFH